MVRYSRSSLYPVFDIAKFDCTFASPNTYIVTELFYWAISSDWYSLIIEFLLFSWTLGGAAATSLNYVAARKRTHWKSD